MVEEQIENSDSQQSDSPAHDESPTNRASRSSGVLQEKSESHSSSEAKAEEIVQTSELSSDTASAKASDSASSAGDLDASNDEIRSIPGMKWYVVQAYSGYENKVKASLLERIRQKGMESFFGHVLIPRENVQDVRAGKAKKVSSRTFYPGYIFVQMKLTDQAWYLVKETPKVSGFVGGRQPTIVPEREIFAIAQQVAEGAAKPKPRVVFQQGDHVRVIDGAFANFTGTIEEVKPEKQKVRVLVSIFGRATPVELDYGQVEKTV